MKVSLISPIVYTESTLYESAPTMDYFTTVGSNPSKTMVDGLEIQSGAYVYQYVGEDFTPPPFSAGDASFELGDVVLYNNYLYKVTGKECGSCPIQIRPKEPEEYLGFDTTLDHTTWTHRYLRLPHISGLSNLGTFNNKWYYLYPSVDGWIWSAKDVSIPNSTMTPSNYLRNTLITSDMFSWGTDIPSVIENFGAIGATKTPTVNCKSAIFRNNYIYIRTHLDLPVEYGAFNITTGSPDYRLTPIATPMDIAGFVMKRPIVPLGLFDKKDCTSITNYPQTNKVTISFMNTSVTDTIALGNCIADTIDLTVVTVAYNQTITSITNYPIYNDICGSYAQGVTSVLYLPEKLNEECYITITLNGSMVKVGDISVGDMICLGSTTTAFNNDYKDFSPFEQDQWGNIVYKDGVRVKQYSGTVDLLQSDYDKLYRAINMIGGNEVIINGSDTITNKPTNSIDILQSTMVVGRFKTIKLTRGVSTNSMSSYAFTIEERV